MSGQVVCFPSGKGFIIEKQVVFFICADRQQRTDKFAGVHTDSAGLMKDPAAVDYYSFSA